jgi:hypothetical protein
VFLEARTPEPSASAVHFRADRVVAVRAPPYATPSPWAELLFVGGGDTLTVAEEAASLAARIERAVEAARG